MTKENVLFVIIGILVGAIIGFFFANSVNQSAAVRPASTTETAADLPAGHPAVSDSTAGGAAIPEVQSALERAKQNPSDFDAQIKAAELYYQIRRYDQAIELLKKAYALQPGNYEVVVQLGNVNFDVERYAEAEKWYSTALEKKPDDLDVRTDLGLTFIFREDPNYDRAIQEFKRVLDANPSHILALQNLTVAFTKKGDEPKAKESLARLEQADPKNSALAGLREDIQKLENK
jgi:tetratricopeptide (TPR) repeat protein